ncbi:hypothetical protein [Curtobacterium sp. VKM Ac-2922]|uniref:hypothetical protein n=1 Tax=Curtobacterium sp. VKM Ac-2922 TaxID=2929475 RepID=UPI001FB50C4E|nr:hypothetical protein [Curtobacterium sp. VKM Ac-2922]MCJ1715243.1 hypothetical protein [Curtobacterium sp. VKM Ac-2922]
MPAVVLLVVSIVMLLGMTVGLLWRARDAGWMRDEGLVANVHPRAAVVGFVVTGLFVAALAFVGVVMIGGGHPVEGWAWMVLAFVGVELLALQVWVFRQRVTDFGASEDEPPD